MPVDAGPDVEVGAHQEALLVGTETFERPAIGKLSGPYSFCTGTLIASRVILTAAHCFNFNDQRSSQVESTQTPVFPADDSGYEFTMWTNNSHSVTARVRRFANFALGYGSGDLAVAELDRDMGITPMAIAAAEPTQNASTMSYGYGCTEQTYDETKDEWTNHYPSSNAKTKRSSQWDRNSHSTTDPIICPGDSGGPVVVGNQIVAVASATNWGPDYLGLAYNARQWIDAHVAAYGNQQLCTLCKQISLSTWDGVHYVQATNGSVDATTTTVKKFRVVPMSRQLSATAPYLPFYAALQAPDGRFLCGRRRRRVARGQSYSRRRVGDIPY